MTRLLLVLVIVLAVTVVCLAAPPLPETKPGDKTGKDLETSEFFHLGWGPWGGWGGLGWGGWGGWGGYGYPWWG